MKIMSSTKPLLSFSFFLALAICIAPHSSHSLTALHTIHKRAEIVIDGGKEVKEVTEGGGSAFPKTFQVSRDVNRAGKDDSTDHDKQASLVWINKVLDNIPQKEPAYYQNLENELKESIDNMIRPKVWQKIQQAYNDLREHHTKSSEKIKSLLLPMPEGDNLEVGPVEVFLKNLATYKSKALEEDQKTLHDYLPEEKKYLSDVFGFLGPNNVLKNWVRVAFNEKVMSRELKPNYMDRADSDFVSQLKQIQNHLAEVARLIRGNPLNPMIPPDLLEKISDSESGLLKLFGSPDGLKKVLDMMKNMFFHQGFMQQLKEPSSLFGYQLQLLEPWGHLRRVEEIQIEDFPFEQLGINRGPHQLQQIMQESKVALQDIQRSLKTPADMWKEWNNISRIVFHTRYLEKNISKETFRAARDLARNAFYLTSFPFENSGWLLRTRK